LYWVIVQWNQDIRTVSPWEVIPASSGVPLASCVPNPLQQTRLSPARGGNAVAQAITHTLEELYEMMVLHIGQHAHDSGQTCRPCAHSLIILLECVCA